MILKSFMKIFKCLYFASMAFQNVKCFIPITNGSLDLTCLRKPTKCCCVATSRYCPLNLVNNCTVHLVMELCEPFTRKSYGLSKHK